MERAFVLVGLEYWKKHGVTPEACSDRANWVGEHVLEHLLKNERWESAKAICEFMIRDKSQPESVRLVAQINHWQASKWLGEFDEVRREIEATDFSAKEERFQLARAALLDDAARFWPLAIRLVGDGKLACRDLRTWPLFRALREGPDFESRIDECERAAERVRRDTDPSGPTIGSS